MSKLAGGAAFASFTTAAFVGGITEGIGIPLSLIFAGLKAFGGTSIDTWSWWAVFAPAWGGFLLTILFVILAGIAGLVALVRNS